MADTRASRQRPTMNDVAAAADVSLKTVSRVVNGADYVSAEKAERVREAIAALGFRRNEYARGLRAGGSATIGLVLEDTADPFSSVLARAVEEVAFDRGYLLLTASSAEDPRRSERLIGALASRGVEGLVVAAPTSVDARFLAAEIAAGTPIVLVDRLVPEVDADTVIADNRDGAQRGTAALIAHGHRRIAFFGDDPGVYTASERLAGHRAAYAAAGVPMDESLVTMASPPEASAVQHLVDGLLDGDDPPTAFVGGNNRWSVRLLRALRSRAQRGGDDRPAFVGFDDFELADVLDPGVTVIAQDAAAMGRIAGELLFRRLQGDDSPAQRIELRTSLIARGSGELSGPFAS